VHEVYLAAKEIYPFVFSVRFRGAIDLVPKTGFRVFE
jgi:hypothetical protein